MGKQRNVNLNQYTHKTIIFQFLVLQLDKGAEFLSRNEVGKPQFNWTNRQFDWNSLGALKIL